MELLSRAYLGTFGLRWNHLDWLAVLLQLGASARFGRLR
jgi:hypothetical protein